MDIYELFKQDQLELQDLVIRLEKARSPEELEHLLNEIYNTAFIYTRSEEEVLYSALRKKLGDLEILIEAGNHDHKLLLSSVKILQATPLYDRQWERLIKFIKSLLSHHSDQVNEQVFELAKFYLINMDKEEMMAHALKVREALAQKLKKNK